MALKDALKNIASASVSVGFLEGATYETGESVPEVAYKNEYGGPENPPRPFMRATFNAESPKWAGQIAGLVKLGFEPEKILAMMGENIKGAMVQQITDWETPPNSPQTVARKGFNDPLIDTGRMRNSVEFEVK